MIVNLLFYVFGAILVISALGVWWCTWAR